MGILDNITSQIQKSMVNIQNKSKHFSISDEEVAKILIKEETIEIKITQAVPLNAKSIIVTSDRIIVFEKGLIKDGFKDYYFRDMKDISLQDSVAGSIFSFNFDRGNSKGNIEIRYLPKEEAKEFYSKVQKIEHFWWSKRRELSLEEIRAASGSANISVAVPIIPNSFQSVPENKITTPIAPVIIDSIDSRSFSNSTSSSMADEILKLANMKEKGIITETEFQDAKRKLLGMDKEQSNNKEINPQNLVTPPPMNKPPVVPAFKYFIYYEDENQRNKQCSFLDVKQLLKNKEITEDYYIWREGIPDWVLIKDCLDFK